MTRYDLMKFYGYNSLEEMDEATRRSEERVAKRLAEMKAQKTKRLKKSKYVHEDYVRRFIAEAFSENRFATNYDYAILVDKIDEIPATDVQPIAETENMATISDEFICKKCGIYLKDYIKVVMDEDNDGYVDEQHYDYEPKYCPECGAKIKDGDKE